MENKLVLRYMAHACFYAEIGGCKIVFDPYEDGYIPGVRDLEISANLVLCSHGHGDHSAKHKVQLLLNEVDMPKVTEIHCYHDEEKGKLRGENIIHVIEHAGLRFAHCGDLGHSLSDEMIAEIGELDLLMIPVGGTYTVNSPTAKAIADRLKAKVVVPMHYRTQKSGFDVISELEDYVNLCDDVLYYENDFILDKDTKKQTAVLNQVNT